MRSHRIMLVAAAAILAAAPAPAQMTDFAGCKDPELFSRIPGYFMNNQTYCWEKQYDVWKFQVQKGNRVVEEPIEGRLIGRYYTFDTAKNQAMPSDLQIIRNYQNAARKIGGKVLYEDKNNLDLTTILIVKDGKEHWVDVNPSNGGFNYRVVIVEREAMRQDVVANAETFRVGLAEAGHVEIPGIYFDTAKSDVKPESEPALKEIVKLLQKDPALKVWVVGHTDSTGALASNLSLSSARAASVVKALAAMGVDPKRLAPFGNGPYAPVSSNGTEQGRARNRRVELVDQGAAR